MDSPLSHVRDHPLIRAPAYRRFAAHPNYRRGTMATNVMQVRVGDCMAVQVV